MKKPYEWSEEDILSLISNKTKESITLDYKECGSLANTEGKKNELSKDVSAFANSAGGTIIYGVKEDKYVPTEIDNGFAPHEISKEWLEQVINSKIHPRIEGIRINQIDLRISNPGQVIYVVWIPQATSRAPHQAADKRYYKRHDFQSVPMEDYEIRDVLSRGLSPDLYVEINLGNDNKVKFSLEEEYSKPIDLIAAIGNKSSQVAECASIYILLFGEIKIVSHSEFEIHSTNTTLGENIIGLNRLHQNWLVPSKMPIFNTLNYTISKDPIKFSVKKGNDIFWICWQVHSPKMTPKSGILPLNLSNGILSLSKEISEPDLEELATKIGIEFKFNPS